MAKLRIATTIALVSGCILSSAAPAVEVFTSPEARKAWEERQAAELRARKEEERAKKLHKRAEKDAQAAGMPAPVQPSKEPPAPSTPSAATIHGQAPSTDNAPAAAASSGSSDSVPFTSGTAGSSTATTSAPQTPAPSAPPATTAQAPAPAAPKASKGGLMHLRSKKASTPEPDPNAPATKTRAGRAPVVAWINPDVEPKAVLLCVHGLGLHNKSYEEFGKRMAAAGVPTYAVDVRGFGSWMQNSENRQVDFDYCLSDIQKTLEVLHRVHPGLPIFLLGESMGGAIALRATAQYPDQIDGLISCVPSGDRFHQGPTEVRVALHFLRGANKEFDIGHSVVKQASGSNDTEGTTNTKLEQDWLSDSLNRKLLSPKELMQFQKFMDENHKWAKQIKDKPVLMLQGADDALVKATGTLELLSNIPVNNKDVHLLVIRDAKHLIFEESQSNDPALNDRVFRFVNGWIDDHRKKPATAISDAAKAP